MLKKMVIGGIAAAAVPLVIITTAVSSIGSMFSFLTPKDSSSEPSLAEVVITDKPIVGDAYDNTDYLNWYKQAQKEIKTLRSADTHGVTVDASDEDKENMKKQEAVATAFYYSYYVSQGHSFFEDTPGKEYDYKKFLNCFTPEDYAKASYWSKFDGPDSVYGMSFISKTSKLYDAYEMINSMSDMLVADIKDNVDLETILQKTHISKVPPLTS